MTKTRACISCLLLLLSLLLLMLSLRCEYNKRTEVVNGIRMMASQNRTSRTITYHMAYRIVICVHIANFNRIQNYYQLIECLLRVICIQQNYRKVIFANCMYQIGQLLPNERQGRCNRSHKIVRLQCIVLVHHIQPD